jgi:hypothetical protein
MQLKGNASVFKSGANPDQIAPWRGGLMPFS